MVVSRLLGSTSVAHLFFAGGNLLAELFATHWWKVLCGSWVLVVSGWFALVSYTLLSHPPR